MSKSGPTPAPKKKCAVEGCDSLTKGWQPYCSKHYKRAWATGGDPGPAGRIITKPGPKPMVRGKCAVDGCPSLVRAGEYCGMHYQRVRDTGDPGPVERIKPKGSPEVLKAWRATQTLAGSCKHPDGCERHATDHGWCGMHWQRIVKHGEPGKVGTQRVPARGQLCKHPDGCKRPVHASGWCQMHYLRTRLNDGDPGPVGEVRAPQYTGTCKHPDGCKREVLSRGWCAMHLQRVRHNDGDPGPLGPLRPPRVLTIQDRESTTRKCKHPDGCERGAFTLGWCSMHYGRVRKTGDPGPVGRMLSARGQGIDRRALMAGVEINDFTRPQWVWLKRHYGQRCAYCNKKSSALHKEHVIPLVLRGNNTLSNVVPACQACNLRKGAKLVTPEYYRPLPESGWPPGRKEDNEAV